MNKLLEVKPLVSFIIKDYAISLTNIGGSDYLFQKKYLPIP